MRSRARWPAVRAFLWRYAANLWLTLLPLPPLLSLYKISSAEEALDLDLVFEQVTGMFPGLVEPLFNERDRYMAWTLKRSKAVTNCREVVGVIGRGHLDAVCKEIERDYSAQHLSFKRVARLKH